MQKIRNMLKAAMVISVVLALVLPGSAIITNMGTKTDGKMQYKVNTVIETAISRTQSTHKSLIRGEDVLVSWDNPEDDDFNPKITVNTDKTLVATYIKEQGALSELIPVAYSDDNGASWTTQFEFDSSEWEEGSGILESPDITFSEAADNFFWQAIDPIGDDYNVALVWFPSDIGNVEEVIIWRYGWIDSDDYTEGATTYVGEWQVSLNMDLSHGIIDCPALSYNWYDGVETFYQPGEKNPGWAAGGYYDGQSVLETAPASKPEMDTGENRIYMVMETHNESTGYSNISYKATYTDLDPESETFLFTNGGGPGGMDKYCDIEVWPFQMFIANDATDPDVAAKGSTVAVVYTQDGNVKCKASDDDGTNWVESTVEYDAGYPCVYVSESLDMIYVGCVKDGNLYLMESDDLGETWVYSGQINDEDGTVVAEPNTASLGAYGIIWTDDRDDSEDIYFEYHEFEVNNPPGTPAISGPTSGNAGTSHDYVFNAVDPDGDQVKYIINWGDGNSDTTSLNPSGTDVTVSHSWEEEGDYKITATAQDEFGLIGPEGSLDVSMPRSRTMFSRLMDYFPHAFPVLRMLLGL